MVRYAFLGRRVDQTAAVLAVPEVAWTAFATVLSMAVAAVLDAERIADARALVALLLQGDVVDPARAEVVLVSDLAALVTLVACPRVGAS